jgi:hypothetical protein
MTNAIERFLRRNAFDLHQFGRELFEPNDLKQKTAIQDE